MKQLLLVAPFVFLVAAGMPVSAQSRTDDLATRLREVLPSDVASRIGTRLSEARADGLPAEALENRALRFAAKGVAAADVESSVSAQLERMRVARTTLSSARSATPTADEIDAAADALRKGLSRAQLATFAATAPAARSIAVSLLVVSSLMDQGLSMDSALHRVATRVASSASDAEVQRMASPLLMARAQTAFDAGSLMSPADIAADKRTGTTATPSGDGKRPAPPTATPTGDGKRTAPTTTTPPVPKPRTATPPTTTKPTTSAPPTTGTKRG
jgi:hypothetical protein